MAGLDWTAGSDSADTEAIHALESATSLPLGKDAESSARATRDAMRRLSTAMGQREREYFLLRDILNLFVSALEHELSGEAALNVLLTHLHVNAGALLVYNHRQNQFEVSASRNCVVGPYDGPGTRPLAPGLDIIMDCVRERRTVSVTGPLAEMIIELSDWRVETPETIIARPLALDERVPGVILLFVQSGRGSLSQREATLFEMLCESFAVAITHESERLRELDQLKLNLIAALSHELRTPLTSIIGYLEVLSEDTGENLTDEQRSYLEIIATSAQRLSRQVEDLLTMRRITQGTLRLTKGRLSITETLEAQIAATRAASAERQIMVDAYIAPDLPPVVADAEAFREILSHLLVNAAKCTAPRGSIYVSVERCDEGVVVSVANTDSYIPPDEQQQVFTPFYRTAAAERDALQGSGLGLSIARSLVEQQGGRMWLQSAVSSGTTFFFTLPALQSAEQRPAMAAKE